MSYLYLIGGWYLTGLAAIFIANWWESIARNESVKLTRRQLWVAWWGPVALVMLLACLIWSLFDKRGLFKVDL